MAASDDPFETALRALRAHDRTAAELAERLERRGVGEDERANVLDRLARAGYLDDRRFAEGRAAVLAERGAGDALIRDDLERRGVAGELVDDALAGLDPEPERAARIVARRGQGPKTARYLVSRGFGEDALTHVVADVD